jgi:threonine/homoserine/homoserine lactone efflux protein
MFANIIAFIGSVIVITLTPGPDIIFSITQGLVHGKRAGVTTALGLACGNIVHLMLALIGVAVIFKTNILAFTILKYFGVLYLLYLAIQSYRHRHSNFHFGNRPKLEKNLFWRGFIMNVINPKVAIFFIAFFPQFVDPAFGDVHLQMLLLGAIFIILVIMIFGSLSYYAGIIGFLLQQKPKIAKFINLGAALIFVALALRLILVQKF